MDVLWNVLAGFGIVTLLIVLVMAITFIIVFIKQFKELSKDLSNQVSPREIHGHETSEDKWLDKKARDNLVTFLETKGFKNLGKFSVDEMPLISLIAMIEPENKFLAVLYEHPQLGQWLDIVVNYNNDETLTVSSAKLGHQLEHQPKHDKVYLSGGDAQTIYEKAVELSSNKDKLAVPATAADFISHMEKFYRDEMTWRHSRGGATQDEIRKTAELSGIAHDDKAITRAYEIQQSGAYFHLAETLTENLKEQGLIPSAECQEFENSLLFIHDNMSEALLKNLIASDGHKILESDFKNCTSLRAEFIQWNDKLSAEIRYQKLATLKQPTDIDVYRSRTSL